MTSNKTTEQLAFEKSIRLHLLQLPIDSVQIDILKESFPNWLDAAFKSESSDKKAVFDAHIKEDLSNTIWLSLNEEQKSAIMVKAYNSLFAAGKFYPDLPMDSKAVSDKGKEIFGVF